MRIRRVCPRQQIGALSVSRGREMDDPKLYPVGAGLEQMEGSRGPQDRFARPDAYP